jgi:hypothetical protein
MFLRAEARRIDGQLGAFAGRIRRDSWVNQAKFLAEGDTAGVRGQVRQALKTGRYLPEVDTLTLSWSGITTA